MANTKRIRNEGRRAMAKRLAGRMVHEAARLVVEPVGRYVKVTGGTYFAKWPSRADHAARMAAKKAARA